MNDVIWQVFKNCLTFQILVEETKISCLSVKFKSLTDGWVVGVADHHHSRGRHCATKVARSTLHIILILTTVFENHRKSLIQHCERSELRLHFECTKVNQKWSILANFKKNWILQSKLKLQSSNVTFSVIFKHCAHWTVLKKPGFRFNQWFYITTLTFWGHFMKASKRFRI